MSRRRGAGAAYERMIGRRMRSVSMATWLALAVLAVTVTSLVVASLVSLSTGDAVTDRITREQLNGRASLKSDQVARYIGSIRTRTVELATGQEFVAAAEEFIESYADLGGTVAAGASAAEEVASAYRDVFVPQLEATFQAPLRWQSLLPVGDSALYLQSHYVADPELDPAERRLVDDARDGSVWSDVHEDMHPRFLEITERLGLHDLAIVDPRQGVVVYSTAKGLDFATSLDLGPHSGSTMATLVRQVRDEPEAGTVAIADFAPYGAHEGKPIAWFAAPMFDGDRLVAILVLEITQAELDNIMLAMTDEERAVLGETGEAYLVAGNGRMRSVARPFIEDREQFFADITAAGTATQSERAAMEGTGTTVVFQQAIDGDDLARVFSTEDEAIVRTDYLGREAITASESVAIEGLDWAVVSELTKAEFDQPVVDFQRTVLIAVAIFVIVVSFATVGWAGQVFQPLRSLSERLRRTHEGQVWEGVAVPDRGPREFAALAISVDSTIESLYEREADLESAVQQRLDTIRSLLPPAIAERVEAGDRQVLDQIPQAGIAVLAIEGLADAGQVRDVAEHRNMLERVVEELDALAAHHGLERVKIVGDAYFAGCGLTQQFLDYAPRSVRFALDAQLALRELSQGSDYDLDLAAGVHVGPVTIGLAGSARLVYDLWGETGALAHNLARTAAPGVVLVSDAVEVRLPADVEVADWPAAGVWRVAGYRVAGEVSS